MIPLLVWALAETTLAQNKMKAKARARKWFGII
jgi:hypothetical protein